MLDFPFVKFKVKRLNKEIEPQETLLDVLAQKKEKELGISEQKLETPLSQKIFKAILVCFFISIFALFAKTAQLQILEGEELSQLSQQNQFVVRSIEAQRGVIYDTNLKQLVFNKPSFDLICRIADLPDDENQRDDILKEVAQILQMDSEDLAEKIKKANAPELLIAKDISHEALILFEAKHYELPGFESKNNSVREYLSGPVFSRLIGYQRKTGEKEGIEAYYDDVLQAQSGKLQVERDVHGNPISKEIISQPLSGQSLVLYLDAELQNSLYQSLKAVISKAGAKSGAAVALSPETGGVLAMVSFPDFDNNLFSQGMTQEEWQKINSDPQKPLFNRVISGIGYPTGSTIKPLIGIAALEEGIINGNTQLYSPLEICIQNPWYPEKEDCYADWQYHGTSDIKRAIAESVNTFFYQVGGGYESFKGLGVTKIKKWLEIFGWGTETGIDLFEEGKGILPNLEDDWRLGDTYHLSIGQGKFSITPLQVTSAYVAIANKGKIFQPQVVQKIINSNKEIIKEINPKIVRTIPAQEKNLEIVRQGMKQAVTSPQGSSYILNSLPVSAAAKTGTAQTGQEDVYHNWVTVFAPYDNPKIVLTVIIENVKGLQAAALPVAKEVLDRYFSK